MRLPRSRNVYGIPVHEKRMHSGSLSSSGPFIPE